MASVDCFERPSTTHNGPSTSPEAVTQTFEKLLWERSSISYAHCFIARWQPMHAALPQKVKNTVLRSDSVNHGCLTALWQPVIFGAVHSTIQSQSRLPVLLKNFREICYA